MHYDDIRLVLLEGVDPVFVFSGCNDLDVAAVVMCEPVDHLVVESGLKPVGTVHVVAKIYRADEFLACQRVLRAGTVEHTSPFTKRRDADHHK